MHRARRPLRFRRTLYCEWRAAAAVGLRAFSAATGEHMQRQLLLGSRRGTALAATTIGRRCVDCLGFVDRDTAAWMSYQ